MQIRDMLQPVPLTSQYTPSGQACSYSLKIGGRKQLQIRVGQAAIKCLISFKETKINTVMATEYVRNCKI
jgi:hypothetical protein